MGTCYSLSSKELIGMKYDDARKLVKTSSILHEPCNRYVMELEIHFDYPVDIVSYDMVYIPSRLPVYVDQSGRITKFGDHMG